MYRDLLADATFHHLFLADAARAGRCVRCGGALHSACYPRKPRGRLCRLGPEHDRRLSFCCAVDGCRSRATPPSLRFLGRKVYLAAIVVLVAIMRHGVTTSRMGRLSQVIGVDRRTVERWRAWREGFTAMRFWQAARASFMPPIDPERLPASLLERFSVTTPIASLSAPSPEAVRTLDSGIPTSAQDARRRVSRLLLGSVLSGQRSAGMLR